MWADLNMRHLLALRAVAEEGTFGRAADRLGFTQSAVSQQVAALEQLVGEQLFDRPSGPRQPVLTPAGELLLQHAHTVIDQVAEAAADMARLQRGAIGTLRVASFQSTSTQVLPRVFRQLRAEAPAAGIEIVEDEIGEQRLGMLTSGDVDVSFQIERLADRFDGCHLGSDPHVALVPRGYPPGVVALADLMKEAMVGTPAGTYCVATLERFLERNDIVLHYAFRSHDNTTVQSMVGAGVGPAIVPLLTVDRTDPLTEIRPTSPKIPSRDIYLLWPKDRTLSPLTKRFIELCQEVCDELLSVPASVG